MSLLDDPHYINRDEQGLEEITIIRDTAINGVIIWKQKKVSEREASKSTQKGWRGNCKKWKWAVHSYLTRGIWCYSKRKAGSGRGKRGGLSWDTTTTIHLKYIWKSEVLLNTHKSKRHQLASQPIHTVKHTVKEVQSPNTSLRTHFHTRAHTAHNCLWKYYNSQFFCFFLYTKDI